MRRERDIPQNARAFIIQEVIRNAEMIGKRISDNDMTEEAYARSTEFQDLLTMPMLRICELVSEYQSVFTEIDPSYPWKDVAKMRSKIAHPYGGFDFGFVWEAIMVDLPGLVRICKDAIQ